MALPVSSLIGHILVFLAAGVLITFFGIRLSGLADRLADRTGLGEAFVGAVLLGACTSLPGITASVTAAIDGYPALAISNAIGGIAVQTTFLVIADMAYPKVNLEHAAASLPNMLQGALLITLLALLLFAMVGPQFALFGVHPVTPLLFIGYGLGMTLVRRARTEPMWRPRMTGATRIDEPQDETNPRSLPLLWLDFLGSGAILMLAGLFLTRSAEWLGGRTGISESLVGGLMVAVTTSLPELVTSMSAVRRGALTLAVSGVLGGNAFDTLFAAVADIAYRPGSIYGAVTQREPSLLALTIIMSGILLLGLLSREKRGPVNIGFEGLLVLGFYVAGVIILGTGG